MCKQVSLTGAASGSLLQLQEICLPHGMQPCAVSIPPGLTAVCGDEGTGKTTLLRWLANAWPAPAARGPQVDALWLDLRLPEYDQHSPEQFW